MTRAVRSAGLGPVTTSKLLARKRPKRFPVIDSMVKQALGPHRQSYWMTLRAVLRDNDRALIDILAAARSEAKLGEDISLIRCSMSWCGWWVTETGTYAPVASFDSSGPLESRYDESVLNVPISHVSRIVFFG
ncbi:DUF6308 family protein [Nocardia salmonicida]|uniref:DUF6308 family protein n=1 Tax=Nocardia salmonicida TaxID=53431 RepID=UPI0033EEA0A3